MTGRRLDDGGEMNEFLWVLQVLLGTAFVGAGLLHAGQSRERLLERLPWVEDFSAPTLKFIGTMEIAGGLGVVLFAATDIAPILTPIAATGLALLMLGAILTHVRRREPAVSPSRASCSCWPRSWPGGASAPIRSELKSPVPGS
jgi:hypothetical protein